MSPAKGEYMQKPVFTFKKKTFKNLFSSGCLFLISVVVILFHFNR